jgi:hypothetical protein
VGTDLIPTGAAPWSPLTRRGDEQCCLVPIGCHDRFVTFFGMVLVLLHKEEQGRDEKGGVRCRDIGCILIMGILMKMANG